MRVTAFTDSGPVDGAICASCASMFSALHEHVDEIRRRQDAAHDAARGRKLAGAGA